MEISYRLLVPAEYNIFWQKITDDELWDALNPTASTMSAEEWNGYCGNENILPLGCFIDNAPAGMLHGMAWAQRSRAMRVSVVAFREYNKLAVDMMRGAAHWCFANIDCACLLGETPTHNRAVINLLQKCGFVKQGVIPGLFWSERRQKFVNGVLSVCTVESLQKVEQDA